MNVCLLNIHKIRPLLFQLFHPFQTRLGIQLLQGQFFLKKGLAELLHLSQVLFLPLHFFHLIFQAAREALFPLENFPHILDGDKKFS